MAVYKQLSDANTDGTIVGQTTTEKVSFHGTTPVVQYAVTLMVTSGSTTAASVAAALVELYTALKAKGIVG
jgi:hypothetical protein